MLIADFDAFPDVAFDMLECDCRLCCLITIDFNVRR